jgi:hypothetical protein
MQLLISMDASAGFDQYGIPAVSQPRINVSSKKDLNRGYYNLAAFLV